MQPLVNRGGAGSALFGGWEINGITTADNCVPRAATQEHNIDNSDSGYNGPDYVSSPNGLSHNRPRGQQVAEFFSMAAFVPAHLTKGPCRFGNVGRHTIIGPGDYEYDFSVHRYIRFKEAKQLEFRAEFFNLFNRAIFAEPNSDLGSAGFGALTRTSADPRENQFALKLSF